ncbi:MAG: sulfite reductase, ferredoxin dependent [Pseudanabaenaceae cyanobacterium]
MTEQTKRSKVEAIKQASNFLRGTLAEELQQPTPNFAQDTTHILKFHGCYQQKDRDFEAQKARGEQPHYMMMLRTRTPAGIIPWQLYLALDRLADQYGNGTLRATTRQGFQLHGILKENLKTVIANIAEHMGSTVGACGDINRNVMAVPAPFKHLPAYRYAQQYAKNIADLLAPQGGAYYDIWLDGELAVTGELPEVTAARNEQGLGRVNTNIPDSPEPIYGDVYLPRKFKIGIAVPGDNSVDLFTNDIGLVVILNDQEELEGFNVYVGGGLGRSHNDDSTIVRLADGIGFVPVSEIYRVIKGIVAVQRDHGDRFNRKHARFKYLLHDWGVERFKQVLQDYYPTPLAPLRPLPPFAYKDYLGWHEQGDGNYFFGVSIENGRIKDEPHYQLKTALREIIGRWQLEVHLTPNHNLLLCEIPASARPEIEAILAQYRIPTPAQIDPLVRYSMACPALPTCGLAITESERALPGVVRRIRQLLERLGLGELELVTRMTGCPNGCSRPYMAELGFVGSGKDEYQLWLGGNLPSTRLAEPYMQKLHLDQLEHHLEPLFSCYKEHRLAEEGFGDFCVRFGHEALRHYADNYKYGKPKRRDERHRINLSTPVYESLKKASTEHRIPMKELAERAITRYLENLSES